MKKIVIIDTGSSNILSLKRAIETFQFNTIVTTDKNEILSANKIFFPGVGAFRKVMEYLNDKRLVEILLNIKEKRIPLFGICLGLQLFFDQSEEFGINKGLGLLSGDVKKLPLKTKDNKNIKVPSMGWFSLNLNRKFSNKSYSKFISCLNERDMYYFVHSYFVIPKKKENIVAHYNFGGHQIPAIVSKDQIIGCQFHPEKSGKKGLDLIDNFLKLTF